LPTTFSDDDLASISSFVQSGLLQCFGHAPTGEEENHGGGVALRLVANREETCPSGEQLRSYPRRPAKSTGSRFFAFDRNIWLASEGSQWPSLGQYS